MIKVFEHKVFGQIRTIVKDGNVLFNLNDAGISLGYIRESKGKMYLRKDRIANIAESLGVTGLTAMDNFKSIKITSEIDFENTYITEDSLYELIIESKAKHAREFRKWVTGEVLPEIRNNGIYISPNASHEQITYNIDTFFANINNYAIEKLESLVSDFIDYHRKKRTKLPFERNSKTRHPNKKQSHLKSMEIIVDQIVEIITVRMNECVARRQDGLANELIKIREMCKVKKENMKYRHTASKLGHANRE